MNGGRWSKLYVCLLDIGLALSYSFNHISQLIAHVKSVKHIGLVRNILWIEIFVLLILRLWIQRTEDLLKSIDVDVNAYRLGVSQVKIKYIYSYILYNHYFLIYSFI